MNNLPLELIEYILFNINDSKTYLNSRLVCRRWLNILKEVKLYENYKEEIFDQTFHHPLGMYLEEVYNESDIKNESFFTSFLNYTC